MEDLLCCPTLHRVFQAEPNTFVYKSGSLPGRRRRRNHRHDWIVTLQILSRMVL